jgi:hypothetical protein
MLSRSRSADGREATGQLVEFIRTSDSRLLVLQHSRDADASWLLLLFPPGKRVPRYAVKLAGSAGAAARVIGEAGRLADLASRVGPRLSLSVPRPLGIYDHQGWPALVTTAQPGTPMLVGYHRGRPAAHVTVHADLAAVERWLLRLQSACTGPARALHVPEGTLRGLEELAETEPRAARVLSQAHALDRRLRRRWVRTTLVHGDFWPGNLLTDKGEVSGVVDWERSEPAGSPLRDPARFVLAYSYYLDRHTRSGRQVAGHPQLVAGVPGAGVSYALDGSGWYPEAVRRFLGRAADRAGVPASCARDAVLLEVATVAAESTDREFIRHHLDLFLTLGDGLE